MRKTKRTKPFGNGVKARASDPRDPRFVYVALTNSKDLIVCKLDNGHLYELPVATLAISGEHGHSAPVSIDSVEDGTAAMVRLDSGSEIDFPVDFVLHHCEPAYRYYVGKARAASGVGENIRRSRMEKRLTLAQLAGKTGIAEPNLSRIEHGKHSPTLATIQSIARALKMEPAELVVRGTRIEALARVS